MRWFQTVGRVRLETVERVVVTGAALIAVFPLAQWYLERTDRRLDRLASLVGAIIVCDARWNENIEYQKVGDSTGVFESLPLHLDFACIEIVGLLQRDPPTAEDVRNLERLLKDAEKSAAEKTERLLGDSEVGKPAAPGEPEAEGD